MTWDASKPLNTDLISNGDDIIRELKADIATALSEEGIFPGSNPSDPVFKWTGKRGASALRPSSPGTGELYFNTELTRLEYWSGSEWTAYDLVYTNNITSAKIADSAVTANKIHSEIAGAGLTYIGGSSGVAVNTDNSTVEVSSDTVRVKDLGISTAKIAESAVTNAKLGNDISAAKIVAGTLAVARGGTGIATKVFNAVSYVGNGAGSRNVAHGMGAVPDFILIIRLDNNTSVPVCWGTGYQAGNSRQMAGGNMTDGITGVNATDVTLSTSSYVNFNLYNYLMLCWKSQ